ncbi:MAG: hypothetical protein EOP60_11220 [Sphingomonadales bacterium]|nr:MAG: hypothetical protein EOP60_11220 [Sphingomonadales bacterium]
MIRASLTLAALLAAMPAVAQTAPAAPLQQPMGTPWPDPVDADIPEQPFGSSNGARFAAHNYGKCIADKSPEKSRELLAMDFTTSRFQTGMRAVSDANRYCFGRRGKMRSSSVLVAAAMAERLLELDTSRPLNARLARAAAGAAPRSFSPSDAIAVCVVRSAPDEAAALLTSRIASEAERGAVEALSFVVSRCGQGKKLSVSAEGLRAILATAAFRSINAGPVPVAGN